MSTTLIRFGFSSVLAVLALTGPPPADAGREVRTDPALRREDAMTRWRWIGIRTQTDGACPRPRRGEWIVEHLFAPGDGDEPSGEPAQRAAARGATEIPPELRRFCLFTHPRRPPARAIRALEALVGERLQRLETDYMAVAPLATLHQETWHALRDHFLSQAGQAQPALPLTGAKPVRLAVLDTHRTSPTGAPAFQEWSSPHGYTLVNMAKRLLCPGPSPADCAAEVTSRLALPYESFDQLRRSEPNLAEGGLIGTIGDQARAIRREVRAWQRMPQPRPHLVLNLSVGWSGRLGGLEPQVAAMPAAVKAVYRAIEDAVCRGAIVVAAAGNLAAGPQLEAGPTLPAAWEQRGAPSPRSCRQRFDVDPTPAPPPASGGARAYRPLLYAAGGVRAEGSPLFNARPEGTPRLAAFGDHAVIEAPGGETPTATLTGTSVSALVVSAAAAAAWYYRPQLAPHEVMDLLYDSGEDLGRPADFCLGGRPCPKALAVHRVSVCRAMVETCRRGGGTCPPPTKLPACPSWPAPPPDLRGADLSVFDDPRQTRHVDLATLNNTLPPVAACRGETLHFRGRRPKNPCPHRQFYSAAAAPWTGPQPGSDVCPNCTEKHASPGTLYVEIASWLAGTLRDATLKIGSDAYSLGVGPLAAGDRVKVTNLPAFSSDAGPVILAFTLNRRLSATSAVLVIPPETE